MAGHRILNALMYHSDDMCVLKGKGRRYTLLPDVGCGTLRTDHGYHSKTEEKIVNLAVVRY